MLELVVIGATLALAAGASGAQLHRRHLAARTLAQYATSRQHVFVPAPTAPRGASPRVEGERGDVRFVVDLYRLGDVVRTRVSTHASHGQLPRVSAVKRRGPWVVQAPTPDDEHAVRHHAGEVMRLLDRRSDVTLACDGSRIALSWQGIETNPLLLDAARDAVTSLAGLRRPHAPYR